LKNYGFKICYREQGKCRFIRHFLTYTKAAAECVMDGYIRDPPAARQDGHILINPSWKIIPVTRREVSVGIWDEPPF